MDAVLSTILGVTGGLEVVEHFQADEAGVAKVGVVEANGRQALFQFADGGIGMWTGCCIRVQRPGARTPWRKQNGELI